MSGNRNRTPAEQREARQKSTLSLHKQLWTHKDANGNTLSVKQYVKRFRTLLKLTRNG